MGCALSATAGLRRPRRCGTRPPATTGRPRPPLPGDTDADVAIVGAGFTGLWTAYYLRRGRPGPADRGARGRGRRVRRVRAQRRLVLGAVPGLAGQRLAALPGADREAALAQHRGDAGHRRRGRPRRRGRGHRRPRRQGRHHQPGPHRRPAAPGPGRGRATPARGDAARTTCGCSTPAEADGVLRRHRHASGRRTPRTARRSIPARLVRGLAAAVERRGVRIHERTPVTAIEPGRAVTDHGTVRADVVVRATEGYTAVARRAAPRTSRRSTR